MKAIQTATFGVDEYEVGGPRTCRPRIQPDQHRRLWLLKKKTGKPITELVGEAIEIYLSSMQKVLNERG